MLRKLYELMIPYEARLRLYKWRHPSEYADLRVAVHPSAKGDFSLKPYDEHKCIFVHITKTAGTSVAKSLFNYLPYHYTAIQYRVIYGTETFNDYYKFAFVRNPWDRVYSAYRYLKAGGWNDDDKQWSEENLHGYPEFNDFIIDWLTPDNLNRHLHFKPQYEFLCDSKDRILVDHIARFETLNEDFALIAEKLKLKTRLGKHNLNPAKGYQEIYTDKAIDIVAEVYKKDIDMFAYQFEPTGS